MKIFFFYDWIRKDSILEKNHAIKAIQSYYYLHCGVWMREIKDIGRNNKERYTTHAMEVIVMVVYLMATSVNESMEQNIKEVTLKWIETKRELRQVSCIRFQFVNIEQRWNWQANGADLWPVTKRTPCKPKDIATTSKCTRN